MAVASAVLVLNSLQHFTQQYAKIFILPGQSATTCCSSLHENCALSDFDFSCNKIQHFYCSLKYCTMLLSMNCCADLNAHAPMQHPRMGILSFVFILI